ncbi:MAG: hypothetical protein V3V01_02930 [Acidimicrobiales bacterium]
MDTATSDRGETIHLMHEREIDDRLANPTRSDADASSVSKAVDLAERENKVRASKIIGATGLGLAVIALIAIFGPRAFGGDDAVVTSVETATTTVTIVDREPDAVGFEEPPQPEETTEKIQPEPEPVKAVAPPAVTVGDQPMALRSMGLLEIGMTVAQAEEAIGGTIIEPDYSADCHQTTIGGDPLSPILMVIGTGNFGGRRITRIDMVAGNATRSGIGIGSTKIDVITTYETRIEVSPLSADASQGYEYLTFVPADTADAEFRIVMETSGDNVVAIRNGSLPWVEWPQGCQ